MTQDLHALKGRKNDMNGEEALPFPVIPFLEK
jgi:hypothetical protein